MDLLAHLWLPIVVSAVAVFVLSAASHMLTPWRRTEWGRTAAQDALQRAIEGVAPGQYGFPAAPSQKEQMGPEWMARWAKGPSGWLTVAPPGPFSMGRNMGLSLLAFLVITLLVAYLACLSLGPGTATLTIVRFFSTAGVLAYAAGPVFASIWYHRPWRTWLMDLFDAFLFGFATAAVFALLWPR
jgi:hypothetical protein